jgi:hypothetical protein
MRIVRATGKQGRTRRGTYHVKGRDISEEVKISKMERLREEEVLQFEKNLLKKLEERLGPLLNKAAADAAKKAMHQLRLEMMEHISRHEQHIRHLKKVEAGLEHIPTNKSF